MKRFFWQVLPLLVAVLVVPGDILLAEVQAKSTAGHHYLGLQVGGGIASYREDLVVPLSFDGPGFSLGGIYTHETNKNIVQLRLKFDIGLLHNRFSHEAYTTGAELRGYWLRRVKQEWLGGNLWGGICLPLRMINLFIDSWDDSHLYWLTSHGVGAAIDWRKPLSPTKKVILHLEFPVLSFVSRPPEYRYNKQDALNHVSFHLSEPNRHLQLETPEMYRALLLQVLFRRTVGNSLLNMGMEFRYDHCRIPENIWGLNTSVFFSYQWRIG